MTGSYKIALGGSLVLFLIVVGYYVFQDSADPERPAVDTAATDTDTGVAQPGPATSLAEVTRTRPAPAAPTTTSTVRPTPSPMVARPAAESADAAVESQADALRRRLLATQQAMRTTESDPTAAGAAQSSTALAARDALSGNSTAGTSGPAPAASTGPQPAPAPATDRPAWLTGATNSGATSPTASTTGNATPSTATGAATVAATTTRQPAQPAAPRTYTVQAGDTLSSIANKVFGSERMWVDIAQANPTIDPIRLKIGQVLRLPSREEIRQAQEPTAAAPTAAVQYTVRSGDTLSSIAQQYYGDPTEWRYIFNANRDQLGSNPDAIRAGMQITVPPVPRVAR